jgi:hypothetical protein
VGVSSPSDVVDAVERAQAELPAGAVIDPAPPAPPAATA